MTARNPAKHARARAHAWARLTTQIAAAFGCFFWLFALAALVLAYPTGTLDLQHNFNQFHEYHLELFVVAPLFLVMSLFGFIYAMVTDTRPLVRFQEQDTGASSRGSRSERGVSA